MICDPAMLVECDRCGETYWFDLSRLANGGWGTHKLAGTLLHAGWTTADDEHLCPDCTDEAAHAG